MVILLMYMIINNVQHYILDVHNYEFCKIFKCTMYMIEFEKGIMYICLSFKGGIALIFHIAIIGHDQMIC